MRAAKSLERLAPAPDRRLIRTYCRPSTPVTVSRELSRPGRRRPPASTTVPARRRTAARRSVPPAAVGGRHRAGEAVVNQAEERRCVPFVDAARIRIPLAERPLAADVGIDPLARERREVGAGRVLVEAVAADAGPGRERILIAVGGRRHGDVVERRELAAEPRSRIVLIGDGVDAQPGDERVDVSGRPGRAACCSACASVLAPPHTAIQSGRGSGLAAAPRISSAPGDMRSGPTACIPNPVCPGTTSGRSAAGSGKPGACRCSDACTWA